MWVGFLLGLVYCLLVFRGEGEPPRIKFTCGPFKEGMLYLCGHHIHHWIIFLPLSAIACLLQVWDLASFSLVMTLQGLTYPDRCVTQDLETGGLEEIEEEK